VQPVAPTIAPTIAATTVWCKHSITVFKYERAGPFTHTLRVAVSSDRWPARCALPRDARNMRAVALR